MLDCHKVIVKIQTLGFKSLERNKKQVELTGAEDKKQAVH